MRRSALRAIGAVLLWCACLMAQAAATPPAAGVAHVPPPIATNGDWGITLYGQSLYWIDDHENVTVDEVEAAGDTLPWQVRRRDQQNALRGRALWVRFDAAVQPGEDWLLEVGVGAAAYDKVQLFYRDHTGHWVNEQSGTSLAVSQWDVPGRVPTFRLVRDDPRTVRYWLRIEDERSIFSAPLTLYREDALQAKREREQFLFGVYFGLAGLIALASLANGLVFRDRAFVVFAVYIAFMAAGQMASAGIGAQHLGREWRVWNGLSIALWPGVITAAGVWFVKVVAEPVRLSRGLDLGVWALIAALLGAVAVDVVFGTPHTTRLVLVLTSLSLLAMLSMALWGWIDGRDPNLRLITIGLLPVLLLALFPLARGFGLVPSNVLTRYGVFFGGALELPILYYALNVRLMARRESQLRASALARSDALTGLPHRQALVERLDSSLAHARGQKQMLALLAVRISNLDAIVEEFGRDASDKALVVAASHLRRTIVDFDMAARVGPREFAVLLEAPVTPDMAMSRAQQIVANGLRQVEALPSALTLKFHVTVLMLPDPELDGAASLKWALDGLDQITPDARKLIRPLN